MLEETTLRFCSSRDTDRVSESRLTRFPSVERCSSAGSGLRQLPSTFWPSGAPLLELCCREAKKRNNSVLVQKYHINKLEEMMK